MPSAPTSVSSTHPRATSAGASPVSLLSRGASLGCLALMGSGLVLGSLAEQASAAKAPTPPAFLTFVKEGKKGSQPTHRTRARTPIGLFLVGSNDVAKQYSVCISGRGTRTCWRRALGPFDDFTSVRTLAPKVAGAYRVVWAVGKQRSHWDLMVMKAR